MVNIPQIPQSNPKAGYLSHMLEIEAAVNRVLDSGWYILGSEVASFERQFAEYIGVREAIGVASGTDALELALRACGIGPGDAAFTASHTAIATIVAIERTGAVPVLVDIDPTFYTINPDELEETIRKIVADPAYAKLRPAAVVPVHLYGHPADMPAILVVAERYGLKVIEDCAQSHGALLQGQMTGTWGDISAFSYYPTKNLGALGDGGMVVTDNQVLADRVRSLRQYGWRERYVSEEKGLNSRLDELQAAILNVKLKYLDRENERRIEIAGAYSQALKAEPLVLPITGMNAKHVFHQFVIRTEHRSGLQTWLNHNGIATGIHYPVPLHLQPAYRGRLPAPGSLRVTEEIANRILSLPMFPELVDDQVHQVCRTITEMPGM